MDDQISFLRQQYETLKNGDYNQRTEAISNLRGLNSHDPSSVDLLVWAIYNVPDGAIRLLASEALACIQEKPEHALPLLLTWVEVGLEKKVTEKPQNLEVGMRIAIGAIGKFGPEARFASDLLMRALFECDMNIAGYAALSLSKIGAVEALPALKILRNSKEVGEILQSVLDEAIEKLKSIID